MRLTALCTIFVAAVCFVSIAYADASANPKDVLLRYAVTPGDTNLYDLSMHGTTIVYLGDQTQTTVITNDMVLEQKVSHRDRDQNVITFETTIQSGEMTINGIGTALPMVGQVVRTYMSDRGEMLSQVETNPGLNNMQLVFPEGSVKIGESWTVEIPPNPQLPTPLRVTYEVVDFPVYRERPCVKIRSTIRSARQGDQEADMNLELSASGTIHFDPAAGVVVSNKVGSDMRMVLQQVIDGRPASIITRMQMSVHLELKD